MKADDPRILHRTLHGQDVLIPSVNAWLAIAHGEELEEIPVPLTDWIAAWLPEYSRFDELFLGITLLRGRWRLIPLLLKDERWYRASQVVIEEASAGDVRAASRRLAALDNMPLLDVTDEAAALASRLVRDGGLPEKAMLDAFHVSIATVHGVDYLLTWNCKHIANASLRGKIEAISRAAGYEPTTICTPFELPKD